MRSTKPGSSVEFLKPSELAAHVWTLATYETGQQKTCSLSPGRKGHPGGGEKKKSLEE